MKVKAFDGSDACHGFVGESLGAALPADLHESSDYQDTDQSDVDQVSMEADRRALAQLMTKMEGVYDSKQMDELLEKITVNMEYYVVLRCTYVTISTLSQPSVL